MIKFLHKVNADKHWNINWLCVCHCGKEFIARKKAVVSGNTKSCGCLAGEQHGEAHLTPEYETWSHIKRRCYSKTDHAYVDYGGRGITMCAEWQNSYRAFLRDVGRRPSSQHSIDRINNNGNYEPGNVRWATKKEQANNRRPRSCWRKEC